MARRLKPAAADDVRRALAAREGENLRLLVKHYLALLQEQAPGGAVEVRVPPYAAVQVIEGVRHTRGTPPGVVKTDALTWVALCVGEIEWGQAVADGLVHASGAHRSEWVVANAGCLRGLARAPYRPEPEVAKRPL
ncbi:MAG: sterol carrier family protein [Marmoricola sp.]